MVQTEDSIETISRTSDNCGNHPISQRVRAMTTDGYLEHLGTSAWRFIWTSCQIGPQLFQSHQGLLSTESQLSVLDWPKPPPQNKQQNKTKTNNNTNITMKGIIDNWSVIYAMNPRIIKKKGRVLLPETVFKKLFYYLLRKQNKPLCSWVYSFSHKCTWTVESSGVWLKSLNLEHTAIKKWFCDRVCNLRIRKVSIFSKAKVEDHVKYRRKVGTNRAASKFHSIYMLFCWYNNIITSKILLKWKSKEGFVFPKPSFSPTAAFLSLQRGFLHGVWQNNSNTLVLFILTVSTFTYFRYCR